MTTTHLLGTEALAALRARHRDTLKELAETSDFSDDARRLSEPLANYLLFTHERIRNSPELAELSAADRFYNRYYWHQVLCHHLLRARGSDAGLEQQSHQLLEQAPPNVDWEIVQQLEQSAAFPYGSAPDQQ